MKNILYTFIALFFSISLNAQFYWTSEHVVLNEGMEEEYEKFEAFWGIAKEKAIADGASYIVMGRSIRNNLDYVINELNI